MKIIVEVPETLKIELLYDPVISLLDVYQKKLKSAYYRDTCIAMFRVAQFTMARHGSSLGAHQLMNR